MQRTSQIQIILNKLQKRTGTPIKANVRTSKPICVYHLKRLRFTQGNYKLDAEIDRPKYWNSIFTEIIIDSDVLETFGKKAYVVFEPSSLGSYSGHITKFLDPRYSESVLNKGIIDGVEPEESKAGTVVVRLYFLSSNDCWASMRVPFEAILVCYRPVL
ncbi:hypothetical protein Ciccas_000791 [Cichlidogyrus casuarinus]|uniref:Uncharacterized protein n=1 Tax=Cichlidogyrus casuarinus TaxID=1844966 RepID=A0ABD2QN13_9PLAT